MLTSSKSWTRELRNFPRFVRRESILLIMSSLVASGCSTPTPEVGIVTGKVKLDGKPLSEVSVLFTPEAQSTELNPASGAITDTTGRFELQYSMPNSRDLSAPHTGAGAVLGWHRVIVSDYKMMSELLPGPGRVPLRYADPASSPLRFEVVAGAQVIDIELRAP